FFSALLIDKGKIKEIFKNIPDLKNVEKIDLKESFVYPGFIDTHTHSFEGGLYISRANLENVKSLNEVFAILAEIKPVSGKIFAFKFDENNIKEKRFPTAKELDRIFPDIPVFLRRVDGHSCVINTIAAKQIDWEKTLPDNFDGYLNKRLDSKAATWFKKNIPEEGILLAYQKAAESAAKTGHTTVHTMVDNIRSDINHYEFLKNKLDEFPVEYILYPQTTDVDIALEIGSPRVGGCILADGSFGSHTAALLEPYTDQPDNFGCLYHSDEFWEKFIRKAHDSDLQIAIHCIGDAAISQILKFYEKVQMEQPKDLRHEIIHNELTSDEILDRIAQARVSAVMQPMFDRLWGGENALYETRLGKERTSRTNRLASIYNRGILLTGSSDWYITEMNALKGIDAAVRIHNENERLTPYQAVELYTKNAARLSFDEDRLGTIEIGKQADMVCLNEDIFSSKSIADIEINFVIKKGKIT
ncbi:MAG: amidohydrolase, partial [Candidatus Cloacimonetes bacterium]|nr:amidohydrolase [Candidatus Cloacimonadota bacterium]